MLPTPHTGSYSKASSAILDKQTSKLMVYRAVVNSTLFGRVWDLGTLPKRRKLERVHQMKLHQILRNTSEDRSTNKEVYLRAKARSLETIITRHWLQWAGHLARKTDIRLPNKNSFRCLHRAREHVKPHPVVSRVSPTTPCWRNTWFRLIERGKLQKEWTTEEQSKKNHLPSKTPEYKWKREIETKIRQSSPSSESS